MEYEIEDDGALYDYSTNPSLEHKKPRDRTPSRFQPQNHPADRRGLQKAEFIPEEEHQLA